MKNQIKIKLDKNQYLTYDAESNMFTDGVIMINAKYIVLSDENLQKAIEEKQSFCILKYNPKIKYNKDLLLKEYSNHPSLKKFIINQVNYKDCLKISNITIACKDIEATLSYKYIDIKHRCFVDKKALNYFLKIDELEYFQIETYSAIVAMLDNNFIGVIMPVIPSENALLDFNKIINF